MIERTISQSMYDAAPIEHAKKLEEVKEAIYNKNIDNLTCRMTRKKANGTWTEIDQIAYEKADAHCKELIAIEEAKPIFNPDEKLVVVSDEEYEKQLEEAAKEQTVTDVDESVQGEIPSVRDYKNGEQVF